MLTLGLGSGCTAGFGALLAELFPTEVRSTAMGATYNLARAAQLLTQQKTSSPTCMSSQYRCGCGPPSC